jgi:hypothetical protein
MLKNALFFGLVALMSAVLFPASSYSQEGAKLLTYSSKDNPKAAGHDFTIQYPPPYEKCEADSPDEFLQLYCINDEEGSGDIYYYLSAKIQGLPDNIQPASLQADGSWDLKKLGAFWETVAEQLRGVVARD